MHEPLALQPNTLPPPPLSSHFLQPLRVGSLVLLSSDPTGWAAAPPMDRGSSGSYPGDCLGLLDFPRHLALAPLSPSAGHPALLHAFPHHLWQHPDPPVPCLYGQLPSSPAKPRLVSDKREPESLATSVNNCSFPTCPSGAEPWLRGNGDGSRGTAHYRLYTGLGP